MKLHGHIKLIRALASTIEVCAHINDSRGAVLAHLTSLNYHMIYGPFTKIEQATCHRNADRTHWVISYARTGLEQDSSNA